MYEHLKGRVDNPKRFCKWLKSTGAKMAGGDVLRFLMGEDWDSDIDIYVMDASEKKSVKLNNEAIFLAIAGNTRYILSDDINAKPVINVSELITSKAFNNLFKNIKIDDNRSIIVRSDVVNLYGEFACLLRYSQKERTYWGHNGSLMNCYDNDSDIIRVSEYHYYKYSDLCSDCKSESNDCVSLKMCENSCYNPTKKPIQIISLDPKKHNSIKDYVKTFDLDFCKVMFDGEKFEILHPESLLNKSSVYHSKKYYTDEITKMRKKKYTNRGFKIIDQKNK